MNKTTGIVIGLIAVIGLVTGVVAYNKANVAPKQVAGLFGPTGAQGPQGEKGDRGPVGPQGERGPAGISSAPKLGSVASPDVQSPYLRWGNVSVWQAGVDYNTGTTTVCAIQSPTATSTLQGGGANFSVASTTQTVITISKSLTAFSTSTLGAVALATSTIAANAQGFVNALATSTPTGASVVGNLVFSPSTWFVVGMSGGIGTFSPVGQCTASFLQVAD